MDPTITYLVTFGRVLIDRLPRRVEGEDGRRRFEGNAGQATLEWILIAGGVAALAIIAIGIIAVVIRNRAAEVGNPNGNFPGAGVNNGPASPPTT